jgi:hypothetical protein
MSTNVAGGVTSRRRTEPETLRHPSERTAFVMCVLSSAAVVAAAIAVLVVGTEFFHDHPVVGRHVRSFQVIAAAAILVFPATFIGRHGRMSVARGNAVEVTSTHFPELHRELVRACAKLGVDDVPRLFIGQVQNGMSEVICIHGGRTAIVIDGDRLVPTDWRNALDWLSFIIAREVGAVRLGHARWWVELLTAYAKRIPGLRNPLLVSWMYSRDRCGALAVPNGVRGLVVESVGKDLIDEVDVLAFIEQPAPHGFWGWYGAMLQKKPSLIARARALYTARFFDLDADRARESARRMERSS